MVNVEDFLDKNNIEFKIHNHKAVFTCEEAEKYCVDVNGVPSKNLFLRDEKKKRFFLVIMSAEKRADLKSLGNIFGVKRITFASDVELKEKLGLEPGSVSIFGILNDQDAEVEVFIEKEFYESPVVHFHPNRNTSSLELKKEMFHKFLTLVNHNINVYD